MGVSTATYSAMLKDRDYDVTAHIIAHIDSKCAGGSVKDCEVEMVGEECSCAGRVAPISPTSYLLRVELRVLKIAISSL